MNGSTYQYEYYQPPETARKHVVPAGFDYARATWAQLEAILYDKTYSFKMSTFPNEQRIAKRAELERTIAELNNTSTECMEAVSELQIMTLEDSVASWRKDYLDVADAIARESSGPADLIAAVRQMRKNLGNLNNDYIALERKHAALVAANESLKEALTELLFAVENADETGYVTDVGFLKGFDQLPDKCRAALLSAQTLNG